MAAPRYPAASSPLTIIRPPSRSRRLGAFQCHSVAQAATATASGKHFDSSLRGVPDEESVEDSCVFLCAFFIR